MWESLFPLAILKAIVKKIWVSLVLMGLITSAHAKCPEFVGTDALGRTFTPSPFDKCNSGYQRNGNSGGQTVRRALKAEIACQGGGGNPVYGKCNNGKFVGYFAQTGKPVYGKCTAGGELRAYDPETGSPVYGECN